MTVVVKLHAEVTRSIAVKLVYLIQASAFPMIRKQKWFDTLQITLEYPKIPSKSLIPKNCYINIYGINIRHFIKVFSNVVR